MFAFWIYFYLLQGVFIQALCENIILHLLDDKPSLVYKATCLFIKLLEEIHTKEKASKMNY